MAHPPPSSDMDLIKDPIPELLRRIAIPASVGFFFKTMYNVVDTYYAGLISTEALASLSLCFPIFFTLVALGIGISQGATALVANALGQGERSRALSIALQAVSFALFFSAAMTAVGLWATPGLFAFLGASGSYLETALAYTNPLLVGAVFFLTQDVLNASLNAQGDTRTFRNVLIVGFVLNVALDPWFVRGGFGLPAMGIRGIAYATVLIQAIGCGFVFWRLTQSKLWTRPRLADLVPRRAIFIEIARQGLPAGLNMATVALGIFVITYFVSQFSKAGVAAYGLALRIEQIILLPTIGLNIAMLSLAGQNNGAGRPDRVREAWRASLLTGLSMMIAGGGLLFLAAEPVMALFTDDAEVVRLGVRYLGIASITLCSYVVLFQTVYMLQGLKRPNIAIVIGVYRQIVGPGLVFHLLAFTLGWGLDGIWWGIFAVTWSAAIATYLYGRRVLRQVERKQAEITAEIAP